MANPIKRAALVLGVVILGVCVVGLVAGGLGMLTGSAEERRGPTVEVTAIPQAAIPSMDAAVPVETETATFALG